MSKDQKTIKVVSNTPIINTFDMINMHNAVQNSSNNAYGATEEFIDSMAGISIYLKAVAKLKEHFAGAKIDATNYTRAKSSNSSTAGKAHLELTNKILKIKEIIDVFLKGFAVIHDENTKDFMILLHSRFSFLKDNTDLYYLTQNPKYIIEIEVILDRLNKTFEKMLDILKSGDSSKVQAEEIKNAKLSI